MSALIDALAAITAIGAVGWTAATIIDRTRLGDVLRIITGADT